MFVFAWKTLLPTICFWLLNRDSTRGIDALIQCLVDFSSSFGNSNEELLFHALASLAHRANSNRIWNDTYYFSCSSMNAKIKPQFYGSSWYWIPFQDSSQRHCNRNCKCVEHDHQLFPPLACLRVCLPQVSNANCGGEIISFLNSLSLKWRYVNVFH